MKLGIVSTWFERGATRVSLAYIEALKQRCDISVYARGGDAFPHSDTEWNKPWVYWGEFVPGAPSTFIDRRDFMRWLKREQIDCLLFNEQQSWDIITYLRQDGLWSEKFKRPLMGAYVDYYTDETVPFFSLYDFLLCNTLRHHSVFALHPQALYIPWGTDVDAFTFRQELHENTTFFHSLGYNPERKGTDLLVSAFRRMEDKALRLILHAQRPLSDFPALEQAIDGDPRIRWINEEVPPPGLYHMGDVYVYPSRLDGIGLSLPEALASGLPAVVTDEAPMNEFVREGENGWLVKVARRLKRSDGYYWLMAEADVNELQRILEDIVVDRGRLAIMKTSTRQGAKKRLDWKKNSSGLADELLSLAHQSTDQTVIRQCMAFERERLRCISLKARLHRILIALGARKIKRMLLGRG